MFEIYWTYRSEADFNHLKSELSQSKHYNAVKKTIELLASNPRHQSLQTHEFISLKGPQGEKGDQGLQGATGGYPVHTIGERLVVDFGF